MSFSSRDQNSRLEQTSRISRNNAYSSAHQLDEQNFDNERPAESSYGRRRPSHSLTAGAKSQLSQQNSSAQRQSLKAKVGLKSESLEDESSDNIDDLPSQVQSPPETPQDDFEMQCSPSNRENDVLPRRKHASRDELLQNLSAMLEELRAENAKHLQITQKLEEQIRDSEIVCGRLLQNYLEIGRALELKKRHVKEDRERLAQEQNRRKINNDRIESLVAQISKLILHPSD